MPTSDAFFGVEEPKAGKGMSDLLPPGMFNDMYAAGKSAEPTAEEMEAAAEAVRYSKIVKVKEFHVATYDLSDPEDLKNYKQDVVQIYRLIAERRGVISYNEKRLVVPPGAKPRMIVHIEWYEYMLSITDHMMKGQDNGKKKRSSKKVGNGPNGALEG